MSEELKLEACPFCGSDRIGRGYTERGKHAIYCKDCRAEMRRSDSETFFGLGNRWNRRSPSPEFAALVEAVSELTKHARVEMIDGEPTVFVNGVLMCSPATSRVIYDLRAAAERALKGGGRG